MNNKESGNMVTVKLALAYAPAYNDINIPVTAYSSFEEGYKALSTIFKKYVKDVPIRKDLQELRTAVFSVNSESTENLGKHKRLRNSLFKSYYGGCGDAYLIILQEIISGQLPLFSFDLD